MRRIVVALVLGLMACTASANVPFEELLYKGQAIPFYGNASGELQQMILNSVKRSQLAERMARLTTATVRLRTNLGIGFASCGQTNAFYDPQRGAIYVCLEMIELIAKLARADTEGIMKADKNEFARTIDGAIWGIFFHELGHAIVNINRVPITGREEDVADQFALYFAIHFMEPQNVPVVQPTVWLFSQMAKQVDVASADQETIKRLMSNEHSLDQQRIYNLACWALGANASRGFGTAQYVGLPRERAVRCSGEFASLDRGIKQQFQRYLKLRLQ